MRPPLTTPSLPDDITVANSDILGDACDNDDDNDGLSDTAEGAGCEYRTGLFSGPLQPLNGDSDGDRTRDQAECTMGYNPNEWRRG